MRNTKTLLIAVVMATAPLTALAGKSTIYHCGCNAEGTGLEMVQISVNNNACKRGHSTHQVGDQVACDASGSELLFTRTVDDKYISGGSGTCSVALAAADAGREGANCGAAE